MSQPSVQYLRQYLRVVAFRGIKVEPGDADEDV
jgi:hypothetical protein